MLSNSAECVCGVNAMSGEATDLNIGPFIVMYELRHCLMFHLSDSPGNAIIAKGMLYICIN